MFYQQSILIYDLKYVNMKNYRLYYITFLLTLNLLSSCNLFQKDHYTVDEVTTAEQAEIFIRSINKKDSGFVIFRKEQYVLNACRDLFDSLQVKSYVKSDLDNNGYDDILIIGDPGYEEVSMFGQSGYLNDNERFIIKYVLNFGNDSITTGSIPVIRHEECCYPVIGKDEQGLNFIDYYYRENDSLFCENDICNLKHKKLIYKFGAFIEYNNAPKDFQIQTIEYETTPCFGFCPDFTIIINSNGKAAYNAYAYNDINGKFETTMNENDYSEFTGLLNYLNFPYLPDKFPLKAHDVQGCILTITYDNGKIKKIQDYSLHGSDLFGLFRLYQMFFDLRHNQSWVQLAS